MERSQQRLATLEQEKAGLLARLQQGQGQQQQGGDAAAAVPGGEGGEAVAASGEAAGGASRAATEDSLRQELQAQVWAGGCARMGGGSFCWMPRGCASRCMHAAHVQD